MSYDSPTPPNHRRMPHGLLERRPRIFDPHGKPSRLWIGPPRPFTLQPPARAARGAR
jgi:hypothetical protein